MDAFGGAGGAQNPIETWFYDTPVVTRWLTVSNAVLGVLVTCKIVTPFQLFYSFRAVFVKDQVR
jgi:Derlin-2/3